MTRVAGIAWPKEQFQAFAAAEERLGLDWVTLLGKIKEFESLQTTPYADYAPELVTNLNTLVQEFPLVTRLFSSWDFPGFGWGPFQLRCLHSGCWIVCREPPEDHQRSRGRLEW